MKNPFAKKSLALHKKYRGKIEIAVKMPVKNRADLNLIYTPGVGAVAEDIYKKPERVFEYTNKGNTVAIVSDGSAILGIGNKGPLAALPVMEGKAAIFKEFANIDAVSLVLSTQHMDEIVAAVKAVAPSFAAIQLEDISAPRCFDIERRLQEELDIPVMHDDQHGTAIVVLAALTNALRVVRKKKEDIRIVICGAGAAGIAICKLLALYGFKNITMLDNSGVIRKDRKDLDKSKLDVLSLLTPHGTTLAEEMRGTDVFIGVSAPGIVSSDMVRSMNKDAIVFAMANPIPEIMPDVAKKAGARIVATGRSDFPNQINNALAYPGMFRGLLDYRIKKLLPEHKIRTVRALAGLVKKPNEEYIVPGIFDKRIVPAIKKAMR